MAVRSQQNKSKTTSKSTTKKRSSSRKKSAKPKKRRGQKKSSFQKSIFRFLLLVMMVALVSVGFYLGKKTQEIEALIERGEVEGAYTTKQLLEELSKLKRAAPKQSEVAVTAKKPQPSLSKEKQKPQRDKGVKQQSIQRAKPKLAIIIDDVSRASQLHAIEQTGVVMTPSIFPPSELSMTSHHLAKGRKHYMIHLPMESSNTQFNKQYKTLLRSFGAKEVQERVQELRRLFPHARYVNNHTGSRYTNDYQAMYRLYEALRKEGFVFLDSRTTGSSKVKAVVEAFGERYLSRDIFIDNKHSISYIHRQLQKAVKIAQRRGYAVAIGHPHAVTMQALASANDILKEVELVYIDELYKGER